MQVTDLIEWFYDESSECGVLRCKLCFKLHEISKPRIFRPTPLPAQRILNLPSSGTLATGIFFNKDQTRELIAGKSQYWYKQKNSCIDHLCLIGHGSKTHKQAMNEYKKEYKKESRQKQITKNIFRVAVTDVKLGAASKHFGTLLSLLACCDADIGNIGHSRKNMDSMIYCIEKVINRKTAESLSMSLPSTCNAIENNFSSDILPRLCGAAADGPYQASGF